MLQGELEAKKILGRKMWCEEGVKCGFCFGKEGVQVELRRGERGVPGGAHCTQGKCCKAE